ncbi:MAG: hypothetical protein U0570_08190 [Phycisphaerales bacterium]
MTKNADGAPLNGVSIYVYKPIRMTRTSPVAAATTDAAGTATLRIPDKGVGHTWNFVLTREAWSQSFNTDMHLEEPVAIVIDGDKDRTIDPIRVVLTNSKASD